MNKHIQKIVEGFFCQQPSSHAVKSIFDTQRQNLSNKLMNGYELTDNEWDMVNGFMNGYIVATDGNIRTLCEHAIHSYGYNSSLNWINTSNVTNMCRLFSNDTPFSGYCGDISCWDVSHVTDMSYMFAECKDVPNVSSWNVSSVTNMCGMFEDCYEYEYDIDGDISSWDVSNVKDMSCMFAGCRTLKQDLSRWDVSNVTDMSGMFYGCERFNCDLSGWDTSSVKDWKNHCRMFYNCGIKPQFKPKFQR